mgnify:CR=1 FL=1
MLNTEAMYRELGISKEVYDFGKEIENSLLDRFAEIDKVAEIILRMDGQTPALPEATGSAKIARDRIEDMVYHGELSEMKVVKRNREKYVEEK